MSDKYNHIFTSDLNSGHDFNFGTIRDLPKISEDCYNFLAEIPLIKLNKFVFSPKSHSSPLRRFEDNLKDFEFGSENRKIPLYGKSTEQASESYTDTSKDFQNTPKSITSKKISHKKTQIPSWNEFGFEMPKVSSPKPNEHESPKTSSREGKKEKRKARKHYNSTLDIINDELLKLIMKSLSEENQKKIIDDIKEGKYTNLQRFQNNNPSKAYSKILCDNLVRVMNAIIPTYHIAALKDPLKIYEEVVRELDGSQIDQPAQKKTKDTKMYSINANAVFREKVIYLKMTAKETTYLSQLERELQTEISETEITNIKHEIQNVRNPHEKKYAEIMIKKLDVVVKAQLNQKRLHFAQAIYLEYNKPDVLYAMLGYAQNEHHLAPDVVQNLIEEKYNDNTI